MKTIEVLSIIFMMLAFYAPVFAHCEIPCGIYDDEMRIKMIAENITTIEKSMKQIIELSKEGDKNYNQIVRWIDNKERHAEKLQEIVWQYFMTQRVKPAIDEDESVRKTYLKKLELLHQMLYHAMRAKQTTDLEHVRNLRALLDDFERVYFGREENTLK